MVPAGRVGSVVASRHHPAYARAPMSSLVRRGALAIALALLVTAALAPSSGVPAARAQGPLPACRYDDILTSPRTYDDWAITLVDTILRVPKSYVPPDLVFASEAGIAGGGTRQVRAIVIDDLRAMADAARDADAAIGIQSAYRSYEEQQQVFAGWVAQYGYERALEVSARPGHSEHQLGVTIDFRSQPGGSPFEGDWATTAAGKWMKEHAWEYGWVNSYPKNRMNVTCYDYEPWHFRYVGRALAESIHNSGLTPREYLWAAYTTTIVPPPTPRPPRPSHATAPPTHSPPPSPSPTFAPSPSPAPSATTPPTALPSPEPTLAPTPAPTTAPADPSPALSLDFQTMGWGAVALAAVLVVAWMVLRRGRSRVGL